MKGKGTEYRKGKKGGNSVLRLPEGQHEMIGIAGAAAEEKPKRSGTCATKRQKRENSQEEM